MKKLKDMDIRLHSDVKSEMAIPSYTHKNPLIRYVFRKRLEIVLNFAKNARRKKVLDFGTGTGILLFPLSKMFEKVFGADIDITVSEYMVKDESLKNVKLINLKKTKIPDIQFDLIICADVLEHILNMKSKIRELSTVLNVGGQLIVSGPTETFFYRLGRSIAGFKKHYHHHTVNDVKQNILETKLFSIKKIKKIPSIFPLFEVYLFEKKE